MVTQLSKLNRNFFDAAGQKKGLFCRPLVGNPRRSIRNINDAAPGKAVRFNQMLHGFVVGMGVDSDVLCDGLAVACGTPEQAMHLPVTGKPVNG